MLMGFYMWYDRIAEPWRLLWVLGFTAPVLFFFSFGNDLGVYLGMGVIFTLFITRAIYFWRKRYDC